MERKDYYIIGTHAVEELWRRCPERFLKVYVSNADKGILSKIQKKNISIQKKSKQVLSKLVNTDSHQGIVAKLTPPQIFDLKKDLEKEEKNQCFLILDQIYDPHNFGAILRAAECFQIAGVIWSKNRGVKLTPIVSKTSSGASELVRLFRVSNLVEAINFLKKQNFEVLSAEVSKNSANLFEYSFPDRVAIVLGSEGKGIQPLVQKSCDSSIYIPMKGQISSLNVSQAGSIILSMWSKQINPS